MYSPEYSNDVQTLQQVRNYERTLANRVNSEYKKQPYLPDQSKY